MAEENLIQDVERPYMSVEQRVYDFCEPGIKLVKELGVCTLKGFYEGATSPFRIPTAIRKVCNGQSESYNLGKLGLEGPTPKGSFLKSAGALGGIILGGSLTCTYLAFHQPLKQESTSLMIAAATNAASLGFELGRLPKSIKENLEYKAKKAEESGEQEA